MSNLLINQGTNAAINFDLNGTVNTQVVGLGYGTLSTIGTLPNITGGSIVVTTGTITGNLGTIGTLGLVNTVTTVANLTNGSVNIPNGTLQALGTIGTVGLVTTVTNLTNGTIQNSGTVTGVGSISNIGSIAAVTSGTIQNSGTVTGVGVVTSLTQGSINVTAGTIATLGTMGTLGLLVNGTLASSGTTTGVGTLTNLGSITNLGQVYNAGTIQGGTIQINQMPTNSMTSFGTIGTAGAGTVFGTIQGTVGAGTECIVSDWSMVVTAGTPTIYMGFGTGGGSVPVLGTGVLDQGAFPPGGGLAKAVGAALNSGTNGAIYYGITAGTALFKVSYYKATTTI